MNYSKSKVFFSQNLSHEFTNGVSAELSVPITEDLGKYIGIPTVNGRVSRTTFKYILD